MENRYEMIGEYNFTATGEVLDKHTGKTFDAKLTFKTADRGITFIHTEEGKNVGANLKLTREEYGSMWTIVVDNTEK